MGSPIQTSPTQIDTFLKCPRKWAWAYIGGIWEPEKRFRAFGKRHHLVVETYFTTGKLLTPQDYKAAEPAEFTAKMTPEDLAKDEPLEDYAKSLRLIRRALEKGEIPTYDPAKKMLIEAEILESITPDIFMKGFVDLVHETDRVNVEDHKTTSDLDHAKTPEQLREDVQLNSYGMHLMRASGSRDIPLRLAHVYYCTKNKIKVETLRVPVEVTAEDVERVWNTKIIPTAEQIVKLHRTKPDPMTVEARGPITGLCNAYGGCYYRERCGIQKESNLFQGGANMSDPKSNPLLARLMAKKAESEGAKEEPKVKREAPPPAPPVTQVNPLLAKLQAKAQGMPQVSGEAAKAVAAATGVDLPTGAGLVGSGPLGSVNVTTVDELAKVADGVLPQDASSRTDEASSPVQSEAATTPPEIPRAKRGRKPKAASDRCPGCGTLVALEEGRFKDHPGVDANLKPDAMATCVFGGDTPDEAAAFVAKVRKGKGPQTVADAVKEDLGKDEELDALAGLLKTAQEELAATQVALRERVQESTARAEEIKKLQDTMDEWVRDAADRGEGFTLYVDTYPVRGSGAVIHYDDWVKPAIEAATEATKLPDYALIDYKAKGYLAASISAHIEVNGLPPAMYVSSKSRTWEVAQEMLIPMARRIVKACH